MIVIPAIDIRGGKCVRLVEGDFARETIFGDDPSEMARRWERQGACWIHLVDLDGARDGSPASVGSILDVRRSVGAHLQVGGGIRTMEDARRYLDAGVDRVVVGTAAIYDAALVKDMASRWGERVAVGLDARNGKLAGSGWLDQTDVPAATKAVELRELGVETFVYTDISRDGALSGPNIQELSTMIAVLSHGIIASGGVAGIDDLLDIRNTGADGVIIGRALYDGRISLANAIQEGQADA